MAHIRKIDTNQRRNGRGVAHYEVRWTELAITSDGQRRKRYKQETFSTKADAEARQAEVERERTATGAVTGRDARLEPFAAFAFAWLDALAGTVKARTLVEYRRLYETYVAPEFAARPPVPSGPGEPGACPRDHQARLRRVPAGARCGGAGRRDPGQPRRRGPAPPPERHRRRRAVRATPPHRGAGCSGGRAHRQSTRGLRARGRASGTAFPPSSSVM
jgi:hypothetical protein